MRWPWQKRVPEPEGHERADEALLLAKEQRVEVRKSLAEDQRLAARFRELRERNHFAEAFSRALRD